ncbi:hypothetical protein V6N13_149312 [Hibiscus sabdariffa]|uniref:Uncharacterized protein n=1 Tax=Hibiscus sabdariffa TaxID=183260 RepID=A0ABR2EHQ0_9ROSI
MVADTITDAGQWNWNHLQEFLPAEILDSIATVLMPMPHYGTDVLGWQWSDKREFSVGLAYTVLMGISERVWNSDGVIFDHFRSLNEFEFSCGLQYIVAI